MKKNEDLSNEMREWLKSESPEDFSWFIEATLLEKIENEVFNSEEFANFEEVFDLISFGDWNP